MKKQNSTSVGNVYVRNAIFIVLAFSISMNAAYAYEGYARNPSSRAMSMAGVFSAQSDDSSAIWYNPGALGFYDFIQSDFSIEYGQQIIPSSYDSTLQDNSDSKPETEASVSYLGAYTTLSSPFSANQKLGIGIIYFAPYAIRFNVDSTTNPLTEKKYGQVDARYHQVSTMISSPIMQSMSLGLAIDMLWTSVECLEFDPCVKLGPSALGFSLGGLYELYASADYVIKLSGVWRSAATTRYLSKASSGIGTVINDYLPDRPGMAGVGLNLSKPTPWMLINSNLSYEIVDWSATTTKGKKLTDYHNFGIGFEFLSTVNSGNAIALRFGEKLMRSQESTFTDVFVSAAGAGYEIKKNHIVDLAFEQRRFNSTNYKTNSFTISYAWQK